MKFQTHKAQPTVFGYNVRCLSHTVMTFELKKRENVCDLGKPEAKELCIAHSMAGTEVSLRSVQQC